MKISLHIPYPHTSSSIVLYLMFDGVLIMELDERDEKAF